MADDLLSFKEYEPVHGGAGGGGSSGGATLNVNSPQRSGQPPPQPSAFDEDFGQLIDDMSTSVNATTTQQTAADRTMPPSSTSGACDDVPTNICNVSHGSI